MFKINMLDTLKPWGRAIKYGWLQRSSEYKAQHNWFADKNQNYPPPVFVLGCGRSGTTILGHVLSLHPDVYYLFEPYHLWAAIDPMTDILNFYHRIEAHFLMNESHWTEESQVRFNRLFRNKFYDKKAQIIIEKTPVNTARIGYLDALASQAKFIHIVRDGVDVSLSIERLAKTNSYKIAGKTTLNQWWGVDDYKWKALSRDGAAAGYYPNEVFELSDHRAKGAYEWLVSLGEIERWREKLGKRLYEITYHEMTTNPQKTLQDICEFLSLDKLNIWFEEATSKIKPTSPSKTKILSLPSEMCERFNRYQENFGFVNRAVFVVKN